MIGTLLKFLFNQATTSPNKKVVRQNVVRKPTREENMLFLQKYFPYIYKRYQSIREDVINYPEEKPEWFKNKVQNAEIYMIHRLTGEYIVSSCNRATRESLESYFNKSFAYKEYRQLMRGKITAEMPQQIQYFKEVEVFIEAERKQFARLNKDAEKSRFFIIKDSYPDLFEQCREAELATNQGELCAHVYLAVESMAHKTGVDLRDEGPGTVGFINWLSSMEADIYLLKRGRINTDKLFSDLYDCVRIGFLSRIKELEKRYGHSESLF